MFSIVSYDSQKKKSLTLCTIECIWGMKALFFALHVYRGCDSEGKSLWISEWTKFYNHSTEMNLSRLRIEFTVETKLKSWIWRRPGEWVTLIITQTRRQTHKYAAVCTHTHTHVHTWRDKKPHTQKVKHTSWGVCGWSAGSRYLSPQCVNHT